MIVNPYWFICIIVRFSLILLVRWLYNTINNKKLIKISLSVFLMIIGIGFVYKGFTGSNNEIQIAKVFWHETRYVHGILYLLAGFYLLNDNLNMCSLILLTDLVFSFMYRILLEI